MLNKLLCIIIVASLICPSMTFAADLEFPYKLLGPGKFSLDVPKNETWTVFNDDALTKYKLTFAELKLQLEEQQQLCSLQLTYTQKSNELALENLKAINLIEIKWRDQVIEELEKRTQRTTFLGIPTYMITFVIGSVITAYVARGINN